MSREIKVLHLEPTDVCQAACSLCSREYEVGFDKTQRHHLSMKQIIQVFDVDRIAKLEKMFMCGDYGDPAAGTYTLDIYRQFRKINPNIVLGMNTNGALRTTLWWSKLAAMINRPRDYVVFSIDGLEDTNHIYRRGVNWAKLIDNATAFINAGGVAHWDMLVYQHNQHQVDQCEQLARDLGFKWFKAKVSRRPFINQLQPPTLWPQPQLKTGPIKCIVEQEKSVYINARGKMSPCCWLGVDLQSQITELSDVAPSWDTPNPHPVCKQICSSNSSTQFRDQWRREVEL